MHNTVTLNNTSTYTTEVITDAKVIYILLVHCINTCILNVIQWRVSYRGDTLGFPPFSLSPLPNFHPRAIKISGQVPDPLEVYETLQCS